MRSFGRLGLLVALALGGTLIATAQMTAQAPSTARSTAQYSPDSLESNRLVLGLGFDASYDDNPFNTVVGNGQALFSPRPSIAWNISRPHWNSQLRYSALISRSSRYDFYNQTSHNFDTTFGYEFSPALSFQVHDNFARSISPLTLSGFSEMPLGSNPSYFGQPALRTSNGTDVDGYYRLDAFTTISIGGSYYFQRYSQVNDASLRDSNNAIGRASYQHQISARQTVGGRYDYTKITTPSGFSTVSQRIMLTDDYSFTPNTTLSLFAGPNYVRNSFVSRQGNTTSLLSNAGWSWSAGATYSWKMSKMNMSASAMREISDGGGLVGTVRLTSFEYRIQRSLPYKLSGSVYALYTLNDQLIPQTGLTRSAKYGSAGASITRALRRDLNVRISYDRMEQLLGYYAGNPWIDRDRVTVSINYLFTHPLGR